MAYRQRGIQPPGSMGPSGKEERIMMRTVSALMITAAASVASAGLSITPVDAFIRGGGQGAIDSVINGQSEFFANANEDIVTATSIIGNSVVLGGNAGTGTSGGILDVTGRASGFADMQLAIPLATPRGTDDGPMATITAQLSAASGFSAGDIGDFEGGFVGISGFAIGSIAFDTTERLLAVATGDFIGFPGIDPVMRLEPGRHIFTASINAAINLEGSEVTSGVDLETSNSFNGQIILSRIPSPATAVLLGMPALLRRRR